MRINLPDDDAIDIQMAPLIDCVFLLLIFFLVASQLRQVTRELRLELPAATATTEADVRDDPLIIAIDRTGQAHLDGQPITLDAMTGELARLAENRSDLAIRIDADRQTAYEHVIAVLNALQMHGFSHVALHATDPSAP